MKYTFSGVFHKVLRLKVFLDEHSYRTNYLGLTLGILERVEKKTKINRPRFELF